MSIKHWIAVLTVSVFLPSACFAQQPRSDASTATTQTVPAAGGGANADFNTLIDLIQQVVPGEWDSDEDTMIPYANGVWIDPQGAMHRPAKSAGPRFTPNKETTFALRNTLGELQKPEALRWVSLNQIDALLADPKSSSRLASPAGLLIGGLSRIDYLHWDVEKKTWYIGGPAGDFELDDNGDLCSKTTELPPLLLEDLLTLAPLVLNGTKPFGCTIDPSQEGLAKAAALLNDGQFAKRLSSSPKSFAADLAKSIGPQQLTLINLPEGCSTGVALLIADEHMKRLGLELADDVNREIKLVSYWDAVAKQKKPTAKTMVRWWFAVSEKPVAKVSNPAAGCIDYQFDRSTVRVQTQAHWMQANGQRVAAEEPDPAAEAFATSFTENFSALQKHHPIYGRLRHIFDIAVALEMIRRDSESDPQKLPRNLAQFNNDSQRRTPLGTIDSLVAVKKLNNQTISAVVSGGVLLDARHITTRSATSKPVPKVEQFVIE